MHKPVRWTFITTDGKYPAVEAGKVAWVTTYQAVYDWADRQGNASEIIGLDAQNTVVVVIGMRPGSILGTFRKVGDKL